MSDLIKQNKLQQIDTRLFYQFNRISKDSIKSTSYWVSKTGDGLFYLCLATALYLFEEQFGRYFFLITLLAFAIELPIYLLLKNVVKRHRPFEKLHSFQSHIQPSDKFSMPSGHSAAAFLFATMISFYYPDFAILAYSWASLIATSRILLGVHFPGDTIIGAALGVACAELAISLSLLL